MPKIMMSDIPSLVISISIYAALLFVEFNADYNDGWQKGYPDHKNFEKNGARHIPPSAADTDKSRPWR